MPTRVRGDAAAAAAAEALSRAFAPMTARLCAAPHRDVTHVAYAEWFALYVAALRRCHDDVLPQWRSSTARTAAAAPLHDASVVVAEAMQRAKARVDAMLLSSLLAQHWRDVYTTTNTAAADGVGDGSAVDGKARRARAHVTNAATAASTTAPPPHATPSNAGGVTLPVRDASTWLDVCVRGGGGLHRCLDDVTITAAAAAAVAAKGKHNTRHATTTPLNSSSKDDDDDSSRDAVCGQCELYTSSFLLEPLYGGRCVTTCMTQLRQSAAAIVQRQQQQPQQQQSQTTTIAAQRDDAQRDRHDVDNKHAAAHRVLPLLHVLLPFSVLYRLRAEAYLRPTRVDTPPSAAAAVPPPPLSMQSRHARRTLLQSLTQLLRLQYVVDGGGGGGDNDASGAATASPSTAMCAVRFMSATEEFDALCQLSRHTPHATTTAAAVTASSTVRPHASCARLDVVCTRDDARLAYLTQYVQAQLTHAAASAASAPRVRLVAHGDELRRLRALGVCRVSDTSTVRTTAATASSSSLCVHAEAMQRCGAVVRRLSNREENALHALSQRS